MRGKWLLLGGIAILVAVAAGALSVFHRAQPSKAPAAKPQLVPMAFAGSEVSLPGKIEVQKVIPIAAPIDGVLEQVFVEPGQEVFEGQLLARVRNTQLDSTNEAAKMELEQVQTRVSTLDSSLIATRLEASRARADAARARSEYDRTLKAYQRQQMLVNEGATPRLVFEKAGREFNAAKEDYDTRDTLAKQADERVDMLTRQLDDARNVLAEKQAALDAAKADIAAGEIHSPVDGLLLGVKAKSGEEVNRTMTDLLQLAADLSSLQVVLDPEPPVLERIHPGQVAGVRVAEFPNEEFPGTVREIRGTQVIVEFISPSPAIKPGLTAQVRIKLI